MRHLTPAETIMEFTPGPGWSWHQFDGCLKLAATLDRLIHQGKSIVIDTDLFACAVKLTGQPYKADLHPDIPGSVISVVLKIDSGKLCDRVLILGHPTVHSETTGTFQVTCLPSILKGETPKPDPNPIRSGTWNIRSINTPRTQY